jgi:hypothetical protein
MDRIKIGGKTQSDLDAEHAEEERLRMSDEARAYLCKTDWPVIKAMESWLMETGRLPQEFGRERDEAREWVEEHNDERRTNEQTR